MIQSLSFNLFEKPPLDIALSSISAVQNRPTKANSELSSEHVGTGLKSGLKK